MAKVQKWTIRTEDGEHHLTYTRRMFSGNVTMEIDGECFELPKGKREEIFRLGDEQAILYVDESNRARIRVKGGYAPEDK